MYFVLALDEMHVRALSQFACLFLVKSQLELVRLSREVGTGTDGTPAGGVWLKLNVCLFPPENQEHKARASRSRAS